MFWSFILLDVLTDIIINANITAMLFNILLSLKIYNSKKINIKEFGIQSYEVWKLLPNEIMQKEPFWTLEYADDCISWGDEEQTRKLYEKAFEYYSDIK